MDVEKIASTPLIVATSIPAIPLAVNVAASGGLFENPLGLNSLKNGLWSGSADFGAQLLQQEGDIRAVNYFSVAANSIFANPLTSNFLGSAFKYKG